MSAGAHAYVACDHHDGSKPVGDPGRWCEARIEHGRTAAEARATARKAGWLTGVHNDGSRAQTRRVMPFDFCPDHRPDRKNTDSPKEA